MTSTAPHFAAAISSARAARQLFDVADHLEIADCAVLRDVVKARECVLQRLAGNEVAELFSRIRNARRSE
jgi:hypothetical protein